MKEKEKFHGNIYLTEQNKKEIPPFVCVYIDVDYEISFLYLENAIGGKLCSVE